MQKPWIEAVAFADFTPISLDLKPDTQGYLRLPTKFHDKYVLGKRPSLPREPEAHSQRDRRSWYVDTTVDTPPVESLEVPEATVPATFDRACAPLRRHSKPTQRASAQVCHLHGSGKDHDDAVVDDTLLAVARWIQTQAATGADLAGQHGGSQRFPFPTTPL